MGKIKEFINKLPKSVKASIIALITAALAYVVNIFTNYTDQLISFLNK